MFYESLSSKAMQSSMDALWLKMKIHTDNIANTSTPGYKAKKVTFGEVLTRAEDGGKGKQVTFRTQVTQDNSTTSRVDGNNVSAEKEQLELWRAQAQYSYLTQKISGEYNNLRTIIQQVGK